MARLNLVDVKTFWNDDPLKRMVALSFRDATFGVADAARASADWSSVGRSVRARFFATGSDIDSLISIVRASSKVSHWLELGIKPHITPPQTFKVATQSLTGRRSRAFGKRKGYGGKVALKFPDGGFSRAPVPHPGVAAHPFMKPAAALFPALYRNALRRHV